MSLPLRRKTYGYFISIILSFAFTLLNAQDNSAKKDSVTIPLSIKVGVDAFGPAMHFADRDIFSSEGYVSADLSEKFGVAVAGGYATYNYSQYNYNYINKGYFIKTGVDFNLLKPEVTAGRYWGGISLRYGVSSFAYEVPAFSHENYWGTAFSSVEKTSAWGHFIEISPGFRARLFSNLSMGWSVNLRRLLYTGTGKDLRPIYFPGFGKADSQTSAGISYYFVWNFTYKKIRVKLKVDEPPPAEETQGTTQPATTRPGNTQQPATPARNTRQSIM